MSDKKPSALEIYMKSGNVIRIDSIADYTFKRTERGISEFSISWDKPSRRLLVGTIDLSQIEAICEVTSD